MDQDNAIRELLRTSRVIAMVGLSADEDKPSNAVARYLMGKGYKVIPVNPGQETILGQKSYKSLADIDEKVDIVDIFMKAEKVLPFVRDAIGLRPSAIWLQLGIVTEEAKGLADADKIMFVMDKCVKQEHARLLQGASQASAP
jgi:predicted CoA-binding protein